MAERLPASGPGLCGKKCFRSKGEARKAHRAAHYRIRVYECDVCRGSFHVTNAEKA